MTVMMTVMIMVIVIGVMMVRGVSTPY